MTARDRDNPIGATPDELREMEAALDHLGALDRASAPADLAARAYSGSRSALSASVESARRTEIAVMSAALDELAASELAAAPADLSGRVFDASAPSLRAPALRLVGQDDQQPRVVVRRFTGALRVAAAIALLGVTATAYFVSRPGASAVSVAQDTSHLDAVISVMESLDRATLSEQLSTLMAEADGLDFDASNQADPTDLESM